MRVTDTQSISVRVLIHRYHGTDTPITAVELINVKVNVGLRLFCFTHKPSFAHTKAACFCMLNFMT